MCSIKYEPSEALHRLVENAAHLGYSVVASNHVVVHWDDPEGWYGEG